MKRLSAVFLSVVLVFLLTTGTSAKTIDIAPEGKTVVTHGDWIIEKINNDTQWQLDSYVGTSDEIVTPWIIDNMLVVAYGDHIFANNTAIRRVITYSPLWIIGNYAFIDCKNLEYFQLNGSLYDIGAGAFYGTTALKSINLNESVVKEIKTYTFMNSGLEEVKLPETCTKLGGYSFAQCYQLNKITIPDSVTEIADTAFDKCDNLTIYCYTGSYAQEYAEAQGIPYVLLDAPVTFILGDADGDNHVTIVDATVIQRVLVELRPDPDGMIALRGSSDGDKLNVMHATKIQRWLAQFKISEPIGEVVTRTRV